VNNQEGFIASESMDRFQLLWKVDPAQYPERGLFQSMRSAAISVNAHIIDLAFSGTWSRWKAIGHHARVGVILRIGDVRALRLWITSDWRNLFLRLRFWRRKAAQKLYLPTLKPNLIFFAEVNEQ
jgi:hypothetical protein